MKSATNPFRRIPISLAVAAALASLVPLLAPRTGQAASAEQINADFTRSEAPPGWTPIKGACMTAGTRDGAYASSVNTPLSEIPSCGRKDYLDVTQVGGDENQLGVKPDKDGKGALRLTNNATSQFGGIVSSTVLPGNQGLSVTFSTVTYNGNSYPNPGYNGHPTGADGIGFFMVDAGADGAANDPLSTNPALRFILGATGGALGAACSNSNTISDGLSGGFISLGMDEYGNYMNSADVGSVGVTSTTNTASQFQGNRVGLRGRGDTNFRMLQRQWPSYFPTSLFGSYPTSNANFLRRQQIATKLTCRQGYVSDWSKVKTWDANAPQKAETVPKNTLTLPNYAPIASGTAVLPWSTPIAMTATRSRQDAIPITYSLKITSSGQLDFDYSYNGGVKQPVLKGTDLTEGGKSPLPKFLRFGFSGSTGGGTNVHELMCFKAATDFASSSSASVNTQQVGELRTGTQVFSSAFNADNWWGRVTAQDLLYDARTGLASYGPYNWDASCVLTGGSCTATGVNGMSAQASAQRNILTWNGTSGVPLKWTSLSSATQTALNAGDSKGMDRLAWLRGDRSKEYDSQNNPTGIFRRRTGVLGDVQGSSPISVGLMDAAVYPEKFEDKLYPRATGLESGYPAFAKARSTRTNVVVIGANDGMVHGFRAGSFDASGKFVSTGNDGRELFAYMPDYVARQIHTTAPATDYSNNLYAHSFYVDAAPVTDELYHSGAWRTWVVGGLGGGGKAIYALDVTSPESVTESNAAASVVGEWNDQTLSCVGDATCGKNLGSTYGTPVIRRLHNGSWGVIFGNGLESSTGTAGVFIMMVDPANGSRTFRFLDTGSRMVSPPRPSIGSGSAASTTTSNGIHVVAPADLDGDHVVDFLYAGDVNGALWRFDLSSSNPADWGVKRLFQGQPGQPITSAPAVTLEQSPDNKAPRVMVSFGTGARIDATLTNPTRYATAGQNIYGVWDADFSAWNARSTASISLSSLPSPAVVTPSSMVSQELNTTTVGTHSVRTLSQNPVCWKGSTICKGSNDHRGWKIGLSLVNGDHPVPEQVISQFVLYGAALVVNTTIPNSTAGTLCTPRRDDGFTLAINPGTGGATPQAFFADPSRTGTGAVVSGVQLSATGTPSFVNLPNPGGANTTASSNQAIMVYQREDGTLGAAKANLIGGAANRLTWIEHR